MKLFLDTSSIFKLYHKENDTDIVDRIFNSFTVSSIFLSEITKVEFHSASWKKVRTLEITEFDGQTIIDAFEKDISRYYFTQIDNTITADAKDLIDKYGKQGLRTLDSIQLATAISLKGQCELFITTDKLLQSFFKQEELPVL